MTIPERAIPVDLTLGLGHPTQASTPSLLTLSHLPQLPIKLHRSHQVSSLKQAGQDDPSLLLLHDFGGPDLNKSTFMLVIATNKSDWP